MHVERNAASPGPIVAGFGPRGFRVGEEHHRALLLTVAQVVAWTPPPLAELRADALAMLVESGPEFILLGTGASLERPAPALTRELEAAGIGLEAMDSRAAARAWGVLRGEGRRIAAALYPLD
ncbi:Mth938-like domain-containing protein [uncultured Sphingomonas sp.]|uniref:Mth938-like domain-containing protein n=1 Tax=uncultured Sphingomonas sp. TaxID=158754 RepID=UPI0035CC4DEF